MRAYKSSFFKAEIDIGRQLWHASGLLATRWHGDPVAIDAEIAEIRKTIDAIVAPLNLCVDLRNSGYEYCLVPIEDNPATVLPARFDRDRDYSTEQMQAWEKQNIGRKLWKLQKDAEENHGLSSSASTPMRTFANEFVGHMHLRVERRGNGNEHCLVSTLFPSQEML